MSDPLNPDIWMPHFMFVLQSVSHCYPGQPSSVMKRKYYDFIQNLPILMPCPKWQVRFSDLLDEYPVSPFLGSRDAFNTWLYFIRNAVYKMMGKGEQSVTEYNDTYYGEYLPKPLIQHNKLIANRQTIFAVLIIIGIGVGVYLYQ
jgi:hypothetical protein